MWGEYVVSIYLAHFACVRVDFVIVGMKKPSFVFDSVCEFNYISSSSAVRTVMLVSQDPVKFVGRPP